MKSNLDKQEMDRCLKQMDHILDTNFVFNGDGPSEILPGFLWLGDGEDASNIKSLQHHGINHVLNCAGGDINVAYPMDFKVHKFRANDHWQYNLMQHLEGAIAFIDDCKQNGGRVLVHCMAGMNRSATITVAYLLHHFEDMDLLQAVLYTVKRRCWILTNGGFRRQLIQYAHDIGKWKDSNAMTLHSVPSKL